jgi:hypothetical protein
LGDLLVYINNVASIVDSSCATKILRTVNVTEAFCFYRNFGQDIGKAAFSLIDFLNMLDEVPVESIEFHFKRGDFNHWIRDILGDKYLSDHIGMIDTIFSREKLRESIKDIVKKRLRQLTNVDSTGEVNCIFNCNTFRTTSDYIRLEGVYSLEPNTSISSLATDKLKRLIQGKQVTYKKISKNEFGEIVSQVWIKKANVNTIMRKYITELKQNPSSIQIVKKSVYKH